MGVTEPFSFGTFMIYEGRTSYTLMSASISNYFSELRIDMEGRITGLFMDLAAYYGREGNDETRLLGAFIPDAPGASEPAYSQPPGTVRL